MLESDKANFTIGQNGNSKKFIMATLLLQLWNTIMSIRQHQKQFDNARQILSFLREASNVQHKNMICSSETRYRDNKNVAIIIFLVLPFYFIVKLALSCLYYTLEKLECGSTKC